MQWREGGENFNKSGSQLEDSFRRFGSHGRMFPSLFGEKDPFDDHFFTRPFGSLFGSSKFSTEGPAGNMQQPSKLKGPVIEELLSDDERESEDKEKDSANDSGWANRNPLVEHPDDENADGNNSSKRKALIYRTNGNKAEVTQPKTKSVSFKRVSYGGVDGMYYTATSTRRTGDDGVALEESRQADKTTGQATHRISKGIHDKGHSVTRKLDSDGKVDTTQTLHNLNEDELAGFEQAWKGRSDRHLHGWNDIIDFSGSRRGHQADRDPFGEHSGRDGGQTNEHSFLAQSSGKPKKTIRINIE